MAGEGQLRILREGVGAWNRWRAEHSDVQPRLWEVNLSGEELSGVNLSEAALTNACLKDVDLSRASLWGANLWRATITEANLSGADLRGADLSEADLSAADLSGANLRGVILKGADLIRTNLRGADLEGTDLSGAFLSGADLGGANLSWATLNKADLRRADLSGAGVGYTVFGAVDLSDAKGLEAVEHRGPSTVGIDTVYASRGRIPEVFLRGAGVPEEFITYVRSLVGRAIEYYSCFISYSSKDEELAKRLHEGLQAKGVRCWFAPHDMKIGDRFRQRIDEAIRLHDKVLLILSEHSVESDWVATEVEAAFEKERQRGQTVLLPVRIDDPVMTTDHAWAADIRRTRHIGDFTRWKDHDAYTTAFDRLLQDLKAAQA